MARFFNALLFTAVMVISTVGNTTAQGVSPFSKRGSLDFTARDLALMNGTRDELLAAEKGDFVKRWSNPKSGNSGVTTLTQSFTRKGLPCREIRYDLVIEKNRRRYIVPYCRVKDGSWKIAF